MTNISKSILGHLPAGSPVHQFTLENNSGLVVKLMEYGAGITSILAPDKSGNSAEIVLGHETIEEWLSDGYYLGKLVGRYANRIAGGRFSIGDHEYRLELNDGENSLHGGGRVLFGRSHGPPLVPIPSPVAKLVIGGVHRPEGAGGGGFRHRDELVYHDVCLASFAMQY